MTKDEMIIQIKLKDKIIESLEESLEILKKRDDFLLALESAGVDNWQGYSYAYEIMDAWEAEK